MSTKINEIIEALKDLPELIAQFKELLEKVKELFGDDESEATE